MGKKRKKGKVKLNLSLCKYPLLRVVASNLGYKEAEEEEEDWVLFWSDTTLHIDRLVHLKFYQKCNHFPGMSEITRKDTLGRNLKRLQKNFPENYNYFPKTFTLPSDFGELRQHFTSNGISPNIFIVKPEASSQGKGIYLTRSLDEIDPMSHIIVQEYLSNPLLIDNTKFDMRIYVLVTSCDPLRIYLYKEGIARFATEVYVPASSSNLGQVYMHLTNYSINKFSNKFVESDDMAADFGSKRSISSVFQRLRRDGYDTEKIWTDIADVIIKTLVAIQPKLKHIYSTCFPNDASGGTMCCELLGFDVILEKDKEGQIKPWLLEVNHSPSLNMDTRIDRELKSQVLSEVFHILDLKQLYQFSKGKFKQTKSMDTEIKSEDPLDIPSSESPVNHESPPKGFNSQLLATLNDSSLSAIEKLKILKGEKMLPKEEIKEKRKQEKKKEKLDKSSNTFKAEVIRSQSTGFLLIYPLSNHSPFSLETSNKIPGQINDESNSQKNKLFESLDEEKYSNLFLPIPLAETAASQLRRESILKQQEEKAQKELEEIFRLKRKVIKRVTSNITPVRPRYMEPRKPHSAQELSSTYQFVSDATEDSIPPSNVQYEQINSNNSSNNNNNNNTSSNFNLLSNSIQFPHTFPIRERTLLIHGQSTSSSSISYISYTTLNNINTQNSMKQPFLPQIIGSNHPKEMNERISQNKYLNQKTTSLSIGRNFFVPLNSVLSVRPIHFVART